MFKAQKRSKDIIKIVLVTSWFNRNFIKLQEYFFCAKKHEYNDFIQWFLLVYVSIWHAFMRVPQRICAI